MLSEAGASRSVHAQARAMAPREAEVFLKALVAAYALMAHADGELANAERRRFFAIIRDTAAFEIFSSDDVSEQVAWHEAAFRSDPETARATAWSQLCEIACQRRAAHVLVSACRELIAADGIAHPAEYRMLSMIKSRLGIDGLFPAT